MRLIDAEELKRILHAESRIVNVFGDVDFEDIGLSRINDIIDNMPTIIIKENKEGSYGTD